MKKSKRSDELPGCSSSTSSGGNRNRLFSRLSLQRLFLNSPLAVGTRRQRGTGHPKRAPQGREVRETATKATETEPPPPPSPQPSPASSPPPTPPPPDCEHKPRSNLVLECPLCLGELPEQCFPSLSTCEHRSCYDCYQQYLRVEISESRTSIACPECSERLHPNDVRMILNDKNVYCKYEDFMVRRVLAVDPDTRWCPQPDCGFAVIASGCASCPKLRCLRPGCPGLFCYHCKADWHPNQTCDAARDQRRSNPLMLPLDAAGASGGSITGAGASPSTNPLNKDTDIKPCPRCSVLIVKMDDGSCNHMTCAVCGAEFCWLCMKEISDLHYLSPSGCTFWGKKPWSRKKKILWQLGTLVGAPVGIGLVAGIALPAMVIGIPVWVGRKLYGRYKYSNKHKRNLVIASGVTASVLVSPLVAGLVVSIGVPILLFYIYGVVPVSLCRSGGCDVSTSGSGFHFDFDDYSEDEGEGDEEEGRGRRVTELGARLGYRGGNIADAIPLDCVSHKGTNPSIGEASLSMDSGSHVEREEEEEAGPSRQRSVRARGCVEVQAEVAQHRLSLCSEETIASDKSGNTAGSGNTADDGAASTRALAGSVLNYKVAGETSRDAAVEVHMPQTSSDTDSRQGEEDAVRKNPEVCGGDSLERVRFDDHVSVFTEGGSSPQKGSSSPSGSTRGVGRTIRHLLLRDVEAQNC